ncbi:SWIM zinc finger domain-containing protein [uncultured Bifidobacterium sp.]|uniref:SWIM zinc finger family protein n=1 Tax=uncultured Bifidobacterium sp. TaxID=165187 RepID=UPI002623B64E|nr:SWIM zinc finger family protein [uncultured Bifidobacterium sp.]
MERTPHLEDFSDLFSYKIYQRALAYYDAGMVRCVSRSAAGLWHAKVMGATGSYDVDVRIRNGRVVSAACSCPYGQKHTYCKHVGAVLLTLDARAQRERRLDADTETEGGTDGEYSQIPHDASRMVGKYWNGQFPASRERGDVPDVESVVDSIDRFTDEDWKAVRRILETACGLPDVEPYLEYLDRRQIRREITASKADSTMNMRLLVPSIRPHDISDLPHGWLTILEAAYEHLNDAAGLRRLYIMYILMARTFPEAVYVRKLREVSGIHWREDRDTIVDYANSHRLNMMHGGSNPAYERLLREEHLPDAADKYSMLQGEDCRLRLFDLVAEASPEDAKKRVCRMLQQPDSPIYQNKDQESAARVGAWLHNLDAVFGGSIAYDLARHIVGMFPQREHLRRALAEYLADSPSIGKTTALSGSDDDVDKEGDADA